MSTRDAVFASSVLLIGSGAWWYHQYHHRRKKGKETSTAIADQDLAVLPCIRNRRSVFPNQFLRNPPPLSDAIIESLLDAALWGPFHGKCFAGCQHPAKFVVLGKQSMVEMQELTLRYYDSHWKEVGWGSGKRGSGKEYQAWRQMTLEEITGRWAPCSHMIAIVMRRQTGPTRLPEWEEAAAVAAATQNMHLQSTKFPQLACYWSSWHDAARDSNEMKEFLKMEPKTSAWASLLWHMPNVVPKSNVSETSPSWPSSGVRRDRLNPMKAVNQVDLSSPITLSMLPRVPTSATSHVP